MTSRYANQTMTLIAGVEVPLGGVSIYVYDIDGNLAALTEDGGGALANPVTSDSYGNFHFNADDGVYTLTYHYGGKQIDSASGVMVGLGPQLPAEIVAALGVPGGAALVGFEQTGAGAVARTLEDKLREGFVSIEDFGGEAAPGFDNYAALVRSFATAAAHGVGEVRLGRGTYEISSASISAGLQIFRPANVALVGLGRGITTIEVTGTSVINSLFQCDHVSNVLTQKMTIKGNNVADTAAVNAGALMIVAMYPDGTTGKTNATEDMTNIVFEDCDIDNFKSAVWFLIENRGNATYSIRRCGSRRCRWISRAPLLGQTALWPGRITVPGHFISWDGTDGPVREPVLDDYTMDAYYAKGCFMLLGDVRGAGEIMRVGALLNAGYQNNADDPTWTLSDTENALDGNGPGQGRGDYAVLLYPKNGNGARDLTIEVGDVEACVGAHFYVNGADAIEIRVDRASGMIDTQNGVLPKGVLSNLVNTNLTFSVGYIENCKRVADLSMDGGNDHGTALEASNLRLHFGMIESMSDTTDIKIDNGATAWVGGIVITGERSGDAQFGVDMRAGTTHGIQDVDLSGFVNNGADYAERWGAVVDAKLRRITSGKRISGTTAAITSSGSSSGSVNTSDMLISDPSVTNDTLPNIAGLQRVGGQSQPLTDGATITPDFGGQRGGFIASDVTLGGNRMLANPANLYAGQRGRIRVIQDGTGSRTLAYGSKWKFPGGAPTLSTAANAVDVISFYVHTSSLIEATLTKALA